MRNAVRSASAVAIALAAQAVQAAGDKTGTEGVTEMQFTGSQFAMLVGALVVLGGVIWVVAKFTK